MVVLTPAQFATSIEKIILGEAANKEVERLRGENAQLLNRIATKDSAIFSLLAEMKIANGTLTNRQDVIKEQEGIIKKLGTNVKRFGFGPQVGYGFSTGKPGAFIGIGFTVNLLRF